MVDGESAKLDTSEHVAYLHTGTFFFRKMITIRRIPLRIYDDSVRD